MQLSSEVLLGLKSLICSQLSSHRVCRSSHQRAKSCYHRYATRLIKGTWHLVGILACHPCMHNIQISAAMSFVETVQVQHVIEMPHNDHLPLGQASR